MAINILAMDGGGSLSLFSLLAIRRIERRCPGFLREVDVFAGTSAGGINGLLMAAAADRTLGLDRAISLWTNNPFDGSLVRDARAALGCVSFYTNQGFVDALRPVFLDMTLGDLAARRQYVVVPSFQLMAPGPAGTVAWQPRVFDNLPGDEPAPELADKVLDIALRTSAAPVFLPIYQGYVDGGLFANNPSMCALTRVMSAALAGDGKRDEIRLLSVGTGLESSSLDVKSADWGWAQWLFDPRRPLALMEAFIEAGEEEITQQCRTLLKRRFYRLNPPMKLGSANLDFDLEDGFKRRGQPGTATIEALLTQAAEAPTWLDEALDWLEAVGWCRGDGQPAESAPNPAGPKPARPAGAKPARRPRRSA